MNVAEDAEFRTNRPELLKQMRAADAIQIQLCQRRTVGYKHVDMVRYRPPPNIVLAKKVLERQFPCPGGFGALVDGELSSNGKGKSDAAVLKIDQISPSKQGPL